MQAFLRFAKQLGESLIYRYYWKLVNGERKMSETSRVSQPQSFFLGTTSRLKSYREFLKLHAAELAPSFSSFDFIKPDENRLSDIIAFLLNPNENHEQGARFFKSFVEFIQKRLSIPDNVGLNLSASTVAREKATNTIENSNRRIDIEITLDHGKEKTGIGIENKPWANDQESQLTDYINHLEKKYNGRFYFIYLSGQGNPPSDNSLNKAELKRLEKEGKLAVISYRELKEWIDNCAMNCMSERVRSFLKDFSIYSEHEFVGGRQMEKDIVIEEALKHEDNLEVTLVIWQSIYEIKHKLLESLKKDLEVQLSNSGLDLQLLWEVNNFDKYDGLSFKKNSWNNISIAFEFQNTELNELLYGIKRNKKMGNNNLLSIDNYFGVGSNSEWWLWFNYYEGSYRRWNESINPWLDIKSGAMAKDIFAKAVDLSDKLGRYASEFNLKL